MFVPSALVVGSSDSAVPKGCQPFSLHSNVCVGDLIAIVACSIAGIGFFFWAIHAIRKMRRSPFNNSEDEEKPDEETEGVDPYHIPSASERGLSMPDRVRTRLALSEPVEGFYRLYEAPIPSEPYSAQGMMTTPRAPRLPPPAGGQSRKSTSHHSGHHGLSMRGGAYGGSYEYGANGEYIGVVSPSRARGSQLHRSGGGYGSHQSMGRMNGDPTMYAY